MLCYRLSVVIVLCCYLCCSVIIVLFYLLIVCTVTLPSGVNPIAADKYIYLSKAARSLCCKGKENVLFDAIYEVQQKELSTFS